MITEQTQHGEVIIENGKATVRFQAYLDAIVSYINQVDFPYTVATVPDASKFPGRSIYVTDEAGGATRATSDGTDWRRDADRAIIS